MQLTKKTNIAAQLATATCVLLGSAQTHAATATSGEWQFDTAILYYGETDRVSLVEGVVSATKDFGDDHIFNGKITYDGLTGASATGAVAQDAVQTFSRPSGKGGYQVAANTTPLDDTFRDSRVQLNANWAQPLSSGIAGGIGVHISKEYDYFSAGLNGNLSFDFNQKNTTLSVGSSFQYDQIDPVGGKPIGLSSMPMRPYSDYDDDDEQSESENSDEFYDSAFTTQYQSREKSADKNTLDVLVGLTQVLNRRTIMQVNYGLSVADGYLNDPYKLLSVVDTTGVTQDIVFEERPDTRTKHNIFWQTKYAMNNGVVDVSYRYMQDDWDIKSHTVESRLRFNVGESGYLQPHFRYYRQGAAEFYRPFLLANEALPEYASADYRLGEMTAYTLGIKYGQKRANGDAWAVRLEYYQQNPQNAGFAEPEALQQQDLYPSIKAMVLQFNYSF